ncbi:hypothetical protein ACE7GA_07675 [Roseomonas sp. CCTCC AB2023176]|uniref:hypothetical protein n=1 Tax=Roseomonas sp. CCTCC AB2023176 TaxID=3342640 RepID=UPI0035DB1FB5
MSTTLITHAAPPIIAVFADEDVALDAIAAEQATLITSPAPGVVVVRPRAGLRERLYAAGAAIVVA